MSLQIRVDDPTRPLPRALVAAHLAGMHGSSPPESVHALDARALTADDVTFWAAWDDGDLVGIGALRRLDDTGGEIKSMRVDDRHRGTGAGRAILRHIIGEARALGLRTLWLETGTTPDFAPARALYASEGFVACPPFGDYRPDPHSAFMTRTL